MTERVTVKAPASTANMGPGLDCLAMSLDLWNTVHVELGEPGLEISGTDVEEVGSIRSNLIMQSFCTPFLESGEDPPDARFICNNGIPIGKGLGSSAAAILCGLIAGNEFAGRTLTSKRILELAASLDGHPDNSTAALLGGCRVVVVDDDGKLITAHIPLAKPISTVIFIPEISIKTTSSRTLLPKTVTMTDAIFNGGRIGLLISALSTGDFSSLSIATQDRLHQPARETLFPHLKVVFAAALDAGALGVFLSGSGSSILALTNGREMTIGYEMAEAASKAGINGDFKVVNPSPKGAHIISS